jgi:hypothetical protein
MFVGEIYPGGNEKDSTGSFSGSQQLGSDMLTAMSAASTAVDLTAALIKSYDTVFEVRSEATFETLAGEECRDRVCPRDQTET